MEFNFSYGNYENIPVMLKVCCTLESLAIKSFYLLLPTFSTLSSSPFFFSPIPTIRSYYLNKSLMVGAGHQYLKNSPRDFNA
jgi:hypothetical protein